MKLLAFSLNDEKKGGGEFVLQQTGHTQPSVTETDAK